MPIVSENTLAIVRWILVVVSGAALILSTLPLLAVFVALVAQPFGAAPPAILVALWFIRQIVKWINWYDDPRCANLPRDVP